MVGETKFGQANNASMQDDLTEVMENLATAAAVDRGTVETLTTVINQLMTDLATANTQLVDALTSNTAFDTTITALQGNERGEGGGRVRFGGGRGRGRRCGHRRGNISGTICRFYCWSCGDKDYHSSVICRTQKPNHKEEGTTSNKIEGLTHGFE